jgi:hypothetical protein
MDGWGVRMDEVLLVWRARQRDGRVRMSSLSVEMREEANRGGT